MSKIKAVPVSLLEQVLNCGTAIGSPFSISHQTLVISHTMSEGQLFLASGLSIVTFTLKCLSPKMAETGIY